MSIEHRTAMGQIAEYCRGEMAPDQHQEMAAHLNSCESCQGVEEAYRSVLAISQVSSDLASHPDAGMLIRWVRRRPEIPVPVREALQNHLSSCRACKEAVDAFTEVSRDEESDTDPSHRDTHDRSSQIVDSRLGSDHEAHAPGHGPQRRLATFGGWAVAAALLLVWSLSHFWDGARSAESDLMAELHPMSVVRGTVRASDASISQILLQPQSTLTPIALVLTLPASLEDATPISIELLNSSGAPVDGVTTQAKQLRDLLADGQVLLLSVSTRRLEVGEHLLRVRAQGAETPLLETRIQIELEEGVR